jgi:hypothetical protein
MATWAAFRRIGQELTALSPMLLTPDDRLAVDAEPAGRVAARLKLHDGRAYLVAVNPTSGDADAVFRMPGIPRMKTVTPMFDSAPPALGEEGKVLQVRMAPLSCAVYALER